jgi:hypothetical protein
MRRACRRLTRPACSTDNKGTELNIVGSIRTAVYSLARVACAICAFAGAPASAADALKFSDLIGWWSAEPTYSGETSRVLLHFLEEEDKQSVRLSLLAIGGYDVPIGTASVSGNTLEMEPYPFTLTYDAAEETLSGFLPEAAVPVYRIPAVFRRIAWMARCMRSKQKRIADSGWEEERHARRTDEPCTRDTLHVTQHTTLYTLHNTGIIE